MHNFPIELQTPDPLPKYLLMALSTSSPLRQHTLARLQLLGLSPNQFIIVADVNLSPTLAHLGQGVQLNS